MSVLLETSLPLPLFRRGKVRDVYDLGDKLLIVSTDRISAFDVVLPSGIPDKGRILNQLSAFWFEKTAHMVPNHFIRVIDSLDTLEKVINELEIFERLHEGRDAHAWAPQVVGRSMLVIKARRIPVECVVRGYLAGSAWAEYKATRCVGNNRLPPGLQESQELPQPIFTPTTKSDVGHDRPLSAADIRAFGIEEIFEELKEKSLVLYQFARDYARERGIIIADTKFEFGFVSGQLILIDELLTPDSSRFWDSSRYRVGESQPSFDKQPVRDWLIASGWDKESAPPELPTHIVRQTCERYREAYTRLTGRPLM